MRYALEKTAHEGPFGTFLSFGRALTFKIPTILIPTLGLLIVSVGVVGF